MQHPKYQQVSTGITLRENNLKELDGGRILDSQGVLVANRRALETNRALLNVVHELVERFEVRRFRYSRLPFLVATNSKEPCPNFVGAPQSGAVLYGHCQHARPKPGGGGCPHP